MTDQLHLIARIAGQRVAISTAAIDSVVEIDMITPVPRAPAHIAGLAALRSRVLTLIDCEAALGLPASARIGPASRDTAGAEPRDAAGAEPRDAIVFVHDGHLYGLVAETVEDVAPLARQPQPLRSAIASEWARVARGWVDHDGAILLVVDPAALLAGPAMSAAA